MVQWMQRFETYQPAALKTLIVQGQADRTVGWRYNLKVLGRLTEAEVLYLPQARHHLVNEHPDHRAAMWRWLDERCGFVAR